MTDDEDRSSIHDRLRDVPIREAGEADRAEDFENAQAEAAFWRAQFETERERLAKLWVAYKDLEAELEMRAQEAKTVAERKVADRLAEVTEDEETGPSSTDRVLEASEAEEAISPAREADGLRVEVEDTERGVHAGRGTCYGLRLVNETSSDMRVSLDVAEVEEDWSALTSFSELELEAEETRDLYLLVRAPEDAEPGEFCAVTLALTTGSGHERQIRTFTAVQSSKPARDEDVDAETVDEIPGLTEQAGSSEEPVEEAEQIEETVLQADDFDRDALIRQTCELLLEELDADLVTAYEVEEDDRLVPAAFAGIQAPEEEPTVTETPLAHRVDEEGGPLVVEDLAEDLDVEAPRHLVRHEASGTIFLTVPGASGPQVLLAVGSRRRAVFSDQEAQQAEKLAGVLARSLGTQRTEPDEA